MPSASDDLPGALQRFVRWFAGPAATPEERKRRRIFNTVVGVLVVLGGIGLIFRGEDLFFAFVGVLLVLVAAGMVLVTWRSG